MRKGQKILERNNNTGITLIALVVTIIILLILAGISIATLTGPNGILTRTDDAKIATEQGKVDEMTRVAIASLYTEYMGDTSKITPQGLAEQINEENNRTDVTASTDTFPTKIKFVQEGLEVEVDVNLKVGETKPEEEPEDIPIYSEDINESQIAPAELFDFEPIKGTASNTKVASTGEMSNLPQKEARITGIKPDYIGTEDSYYEIKYETITDTLIIPYQVEYQGEMYKVTEVDLQIGGASLPDIENIIYPNTVEKIMFDREEGLCGINRIKNVILSENLTEIPDCFFTSSVSLENIVIPSSVTSIGGAAFYKCSLLTEINIPSSVTTIGRMAFDSCVSLVEINIPSSVTTIGSKAFSNCNKLTTINIPEGIKRIEYGTFDDCNALTEINIPSSVTTIGEGAFRSCDALTSINIPSSVTTISEEAFRESYALIEINIAKPKGSLKGEPWGALNATVNWNY